MENNQIYVREEFNIERKNREIQEAETGYEQIGRK
jgi:hypothetical protein